MKVFVAGASGALGSRLVPQLIDAGHDVIGTHNSPGRAELLRTLGAKPVLLDLLDAAAVRKAVLEHEPEAIVHEATALGNAKWGRNFDKVFARTNELRTKGTDALLAAAREAGVRRFVAQSFASYRYAREGGPVKTEDDPLDPTPPANARQSFAAMAYLDQTVTDAGGILLRYGGFYGAANDGLIEPVRQRQFPSSATAAASRPSSTSRTPPQPRSWHSSRTARRSTTSSTTSRRRCGSGCRCSPRPSAPSRPGASRPGWRG
jgi:nucleoside-diphosphate-sugar epimerase